MIVESFSGIRGAYGSELTGDIARRYGHVFYSAVKRKIGREPVLAVGCDTRKSSKALANSIVSAFSKVIDVGVVPVSLVGIGLRAYNADCGIMVTASHNEPEWNGFKFFGNDGAVLKASEMELLIKSFHETSEGEKFTEPKKEITDRSSGILGVYLDFLVKVIGSEGISNIKKSSSMVLVDPNGGAGIILSGILHRMGIGNIALINDRPGIFTRRIEPDNDSLSYLKDIIQKKGIDFAAGFDCDADRVVIILKDGRFVDGNDVLGLVINDMLEGKKGKCVVTNDATSSSVRKIVEKHGCIIREVEVGEANVIEEMKKAEAIAGGEGSNGGVIIPPSTGRDGILTLLYLLKITSKTGKSLSQLVNELPGHFTRQEKVVLNPLIDLKKVRERVKRCYISKGYSFSQSGDETGGIKFMTDKDSFIWFRASKTEAGIFRIISDSSSEETCKKNMEEALQVVKG